MATGEITVVLADDEDVVRTAVRALLDDVEGLTVLDEADNGEDALLSCSAHRPDVVVLDLHMPGDGLATAEQLLASDDGIGIVLLTADDSPLVRQAARELGPVEVVLKSSEDDLTAAVLRAGHR